MRLGTPSSKGRSNNCFGKKLLWLIWLSSFLAPLSKVDFFHHQNFNTRLCFFRFCVLSCYRFRYLPQNSISKNPSVVSLKYSSQTEFGFPGWAKLLLCRMCRCRQLKRKEKKRKEKENVESLKSAKMVMLHWAAVVAKKPFEKSCLFTNSQVIIWNDDIWSMLGNVIN